MPGTCGIEATRIIRELDFQGIIIQFQPAAIRALSMALNLQEPMLIWANVQL